MTAKSFALLAAVALSTVANAQSWNRAYEAGLAAARAGKWVSAREAFQQAAAGRPDDRSGPTVLPGPATERKLWRSGAPYSPNFLAAYSLYRQAVSIVDPTESAKLLRTTAAEMETLLDKGQSSAEAYFYLDVIYTRLDDAAKRRSVADRLAKLGHRPDFKIDDEIVAPEELASMNAQANGGTIKNPATPPVGGGGPPQIFGPGPLVGNVNPAVNANVAPLANKFALVIGQDASRVSGGLVPFAVEDANRVRTALVDFAGYPAANVTLLKNATAAEIKAAANELASRMPDEGTLFVFYAGAGVNLDNKDYLAGADTESAGDIGSMVAKTALFEPFIRHNTRIFCFFEANRPADDLHGPYFGREEVKLGSVAEVYATIAGDIVTPIYRSGVAVGLFANALVLSFAEIRSNQISINSFMQEKLIPILRRGTTGNTGGASTQICTLPRYKNIAADAKL